MIGQGSYATRNMQRKPSHQRPSLLFDLMVSGIANARVHYSSKPSGSTLDAMSTDPLGSSYLVKRLSAASSSLGSTMGSADVGGGGGGIALTSRGSLTPSRAPVKKVTFARWLYSAPYPIKATFSYFVGKQLNVVWTPYKRKSHGVARPVTAVLLPMLLRVPTLPGSCTAATGTYNAHN